MIMDYELSIRLGMNSPVTCLPDTLAKFRDHSSSKTSTQFETRSRELVQFANNFFTQHPTRSDLQALKPLTFGRYHYTLAMGYVSQGRAIQGLKPLFQSLRLYPRFMLERPLQTTYVLKEALLSYLTSARHPSSSASR
jgi:hypothetical protein